MKLTFLGSGSAFTVGADNFQSNMILESESGNRLLIDCGSDIRFSLHSLGLSHLDITDIYISHLHADHVGGLEYIGFSTKFDPRCEKPNLYIENDLADELWNRTLSGGMRSIEGQLTQLDTFFNVHRIKSNNYFTWEGTKFELVKVIHVNNGQFIMPTYGLFFASHGVNTFITTDTQFIVDELIEYYERADRIFHDCETSAFPTKIHAHYQQLSTLPTTIKGKMWLYHYQPGALPSARKNGFCGFVKRGQSFNLSLPIKVPYFSLCQDSVVRYR